MRNFLKSRICVLTLLGFFTGTSLLAQESGLFPLSLLTVPDNTERGLAQSRDLPCKGVIRENAPVLYLSHLSRIGFIKENGDYRLSTGFRHGGNAFQLHYSYQGYALLHRQRVGISYARRFVPGLAADVSFDYGFTNCIEDRCPQRAVFPGLSLAFQKEKWGLVFAYRQTVALNPLQTKVWNEALGVQLGGNCMLYRDLWLGADITKDIRHPVSVSVALSYLLHRHFLFLLQGQINPVRYKMGFGYYAARVQVEIACSYQTPLGFDTSVGLAFKWDKNIHRKKK